jgi:serine/threonine protein kinase
MNCNFDSKKEGKTILVKKQANLADVEMRIYSVLVSDPPVNVPRVVELIECADTRYKVIRYELLIPHELYENDVMTNKLITAKYLQNMFDSYMSLISKNVIHNDLKPTNILLDPTRQEFLLSDFDRSIHVSDGNLLRHLPDINKDFVRFFVMFRDDFKRKHAQKMIDESYETVVILLNSFCGKLDSYNKSGFSQFTTIEQYFEFIRGYLRKIDSKINSLGGGKRRTRKHRHVVNFTSHNQNNRKTKSHVHSSIGRKRNLRRKQRVTRSRKI